ncbi:hypothetical protein JCM3765_006039 [Sporobolomyces pararoseus]
MATESTPSIVTKTLSLELQHPAVPYPLTLIVNQLSSVSVMLFISTPPASQSSMMKDTSVAMPNRIQNSACPSTSVSKSTTSSLALASRLGTFVFPSTPGFLDVDAHGFSYSFEPEQQNDTTYKYSSLSTWINWQKQ